MAAIPTESRIFADRYFRDVRRLEALHAGRISPGTTTWRASLQALQARMAAAPSPVKRAAVLDKAIQYLGSVQPADRQHVTFMNSTRSRSAALFFATFNVGLHPFEGVDEEGLNIMHHLLSCDRHGQISGWVDINLAYVARHAVSRLHERSYDITRDQATGVFAFIGMLGFLTRTCDKHYHGELCLNFGDTLVVGSLKHAVKYNDDGTAMDGSLYDVRTVLPADEVRNRDMLEQGRIAASVVASWFVNGPRPGVGDKLAEQIPFLPHRTDDYVLQTVRH